MSDKISVMIVDDVQATRQNIRKLLELETDIEVTCEAANGEEAVKKASIMVPDIILMDINMPVMDGIAATEVITSEVPQCSIIIISVQGEQDYLRQAMFAGAKDYLVKPFESDELVERIRKINQRERNKRAKFVQMKKEAALGKVITVLGTKGGTGKTTIAVNLAIALGLDEQIKIGIFDADLQFGDVPLYLNIVPKVSIADLVKEIDCLDSNILDSYMTKYKENVKVLAAPLLPEQADGVNCEHIDAILKQLRYNFDYIIVDTAPVLNGLILHILDASDMIVVLSSQDMPSLKNAKLCLEILDKFKYPAEKVKIVMNRVRSIGGMNAEDAARLPQREFWMKVPSDGSTVVLAANQGVPFVLGSPETAVAKSIYNIAYNVVNGDPQSGGKDKTASRPGAAILKQLADGGVSSQNNKKSKEIPLDHFSF